jgi:transposase-like protein
VTKNRSYSIEFKRQLVQEHLAGENLNRVARRHGVPRNLLSIWVGKAAAGAFDEAAGAAALLPEYRARIAALERMVGRQAMELAFLRDASHAAIGTAGFTSRDQRGQATAPERRLGQQAMQTGGSD